MRPVLCFAVLAAALGSAAQDPQSSSDSVEAVDTMASLSAEESAWIDDALGGQVADIPVRVVGIRLLGIDSTLQEFVETLLPVRKGDRLLESELARKLKRNTREMAGRTDLFTSYLALVGGFESDSERVVLVEGTSRYIGTYNGGNAFAYIGDHNRTLRGDHWGVWAGYNRDGFVWDSYLGSGWYLGASGLFDFSLQDEAPDRGFGRFRVGPRVRRILSPTWEVRLEAGLLVAVDSREGRLGGESRAIAIAATPGIEWDQEWRKKGGPMGWRFEVEIPSGRDIESGETFVAPMGDVILRTADESLINTVFLLQGSGVWNRPAYWPSLSHAFSYREGSPNWNLDWAVTGELQERWRGMRRQAWFTRCDMGGLVFAEGFVGREGDRTRKGYSWGPGAWVAFTSPVGVDFVLQTGFGESGYQGTRFVSYTYF